MIRAGEDPDLIAAEEGRHSAETSAVEEEAEDEIENP